MKPFIFRNESLKTFTDISSEEYREYHYPDGGIIRIELPQYLNVSKNGGHRIVDLQNNCYYISSGWRYIHWKPIEGKPHFVK